MKLVLNILLLNLLIIINLNAQFYEQGKNQLAGTPLFNYTINRQFTEDLKNVNILLFVEIFNDDLTFLKSDTSGYDAEFEWLIAVYKDEKLVFSRTLPQYLNVANFEQTNSQTESVILNTDILLESASYQLLLRVIDLNTKKIAQKRIKLNIPNYYQNDVAVSDVLLLNYIDHDSVGGIKHYKPIIKDNFTVKSGLFYVYFNVYTKTPNVEVDLNYNFIRPNGHVDYDTTITKTVDSTLTPHILKVNKKIFKGNSYTIRINAAVGEETSSSEKKITFFWSDIPSSMEDIDLAINQMNFIVSSDSVEYYLKADLAKKQAFFKRFWKRRDPDPDTEINELMDEYFTRINYANKTFQSFGIDGWKTDRGRILIKFGHPDEIDRYPFELNSRPYIIWRYHYLRKIFVFQDYSGFNDYRLHPDYINIEFE